MEPFFLYPSLPYIGHLVSLLKDHIKYIEDKGVQCAQPIFTLPQLTNRIYIISDPRLLPELDKHSKSLSFWHLFSEIMSAFGGMGSRTKATLMRYDFRAQFLRAFAKGVARSDSLSKLTQAIGGRFILSLSKLANIGDDGRVIDLWLWVRHEMTMATTEAVYGPMNPYRDVEAEKGGWLLVENAFLLLKGAFHPALARLLTRSGYNGRESLVLAFKKYFHLDGPNQASLLMQSLHDLLQKVEFSTEEESRLHTSLFIGLVGNAAPTAFWTIYHVLSDEALLTLVRAEVERHVTIERSEGARNVVYRVSARDLRKSQLIISIINEAIRYASMSLSGRVVLKDTVIDGQYLLKQGSQVLYATHAMNFHKQWWGADAEQFDPRRFCRKYEKEEQDPTNAFRGFGSGPNVCTGKQLAYTELALLLTLLVVRYEIQPLSGKWERPKPAAVKTFLVTPIPQSPLHISVQSRRGWNDGKWELLQ